MSTQCVFGDLKFQGICHFVHVGKNCFWGASLLGQLLSVSINVCDQWWLMNSKLSFSIKMYVRIYIYT